MGKTDKFTPVLKLQYVSWPENRSTQQFVCCMASGCMLALGRMMNGRGKPFDAQFGEWLENAGRGITNTCGKHVAPMSAGVQRSLLHSIQTISESCPGIGDGTTPLSELPPRVVRIVGAATWPLVDDAARFCPLWSVKAKGLWAEARDRLWDWIDRECQRFPSVADEGWLLTEKVIHAAGYYI